MFHTEYHWKTFQVFMQRPQTIGIGKGNHHFRTEATKVKSPLESPSPLPPPLSLILLAVLYLSTHCIWSRGVFPHIISVTFVQVRSPKHVPCFCGTRVFGLWPVKTKSDWKNVLENFPSFVGRIASWPLTLQHHPFTEGRSTPKLFWMHAQTCPCFPTVARYVFSILTRD